MAHWAKIDANGIVENIIVTSNEEADEGESWIAENLEGSWLKTSYNTHKNIHLLGGIPFRKNFAQPGYSYIARIDGFVPPKDVGEEDFVLNENLGIWIPPIPAPLDADFIVKYGPSYSIKDITETSKVYFWMPDQNVWGMRPNADYPKPEGNYYWNPIEKAWLENPDSNL